MYTDVLYNTPADFDPRDKQRSQWGDLPIIVGSFSGSLVGNQWKFTINSDDLTPRTNGYPQMTPTKAVPTDRQTILDTVEGTLALRTGFKLQTRPVGLPLAPGPTITKEKITDIIDAAQERKLINSVNRKDTGFDIVK